MENLNYVCVCGGGTGILAERSSNEESRQERMAAGTVGGTAVRVGNC